MLAKLFILSIEMKNYELKNNWTALWSVKGIGFRHFWNCQRYLKKDRNRWHEFWVGKNDAHRSCGINEKASEEVKKFIDEHNLSTYLEELKKKDISVITILDDFYPKLLKEIDDPPPVIFSRGDMSLLKNQLPIAVVGTRQMTAYGEMACRKIITDLATHRATIISGFMYGVDVCAQHQAIQLQGKTIGVLGFGFDHMYPVSQHKLFETFLQKGACFISEFPPSVAPSSTNFPRRNRLVAGMSQAVVVVEAAEKSGSHITARAALDYGRLVAAVPGPISNPYCVGTKNLINQGAVLINSGLDLLLELGYSFDRLGTEDTTQHATGTTHQQEMPQVGSSKAATTALSLRTSKPNQLGSTERTSLLISDSLSTNQQTILRQICDSCLNDDELVERTGLSAAQVSTDLTQLQLFDLIRKKLGKWQPTKLVF
ncbi:MAG: DNA-processing protein DprA [Patescibacteria group bacterium]